MLGYLFGNAKWVAIFLSFHDCRVDIDQSISVGLMLKTAPIIGLMEAVEHGDSAQIHPVQAGIAEGVVVVQLQAAQVRRSFLETTLNSILLYNFKVLAERDADKFYVCFV